MSRFGSRSFGKSLCKFCGKPIGGNMMTWHVLNKCKPAKEKREQERMERIKSKPVHELRLGEAFESGRVDEFKAYLDSMKSE